MTVFFERNSSDWINSDGMIKSATYIHCLRVMNGKYGVAYKHSTLQSCGIVVIVLQQRSNCQICILHSIFQKHTHMHKFCGIMLLLFATQFCPLDGECEKTKSKFTVFHIRTRLLRFCFLIMVFGEIFPIQQWYIVLSYCNHL